MKLALVFPGQGSQYVGMGRTLGQYSSTARETFQEADEVLRFPLTRLCFEGPEEDLRLTENTQPAILAASVAAYRALGSQVDLKPRWVAGHSLGEYTALVAAGSISFADALRSVRERGKAMQKAVPAGEGAMAAMMGMEREEVNAICRELSEDHGLVAPANYNSPGQVVIAGHRHKVQEAIALFKERGGKRAVELPVSAPFHCSLMAPAALRMKEVLGDISIDSLNTVLINNAEARPLATAAEVVPSLVKQITNPVLWEDSVRFITADGGGCFIEIGPGRVLTGLIRKIEKDVTAQSFCAPEEFDAVVPLAEGAD